MYEAEDRGVGSDPERHNDDSDNGEARALDQVAKGVAKIELQGLFDSAVLRTLYAGVVPHH